MDTWLKADGYLKNHCDKLWNCLPGLSQKTFFLHENFTEDTSDENDTIWLHGIEQFFNDNECPWDTIILQLEIWNYPEIEQIIANHPRLQNKNVFVLTFGYQQYQFGPRCWKINFPWCIVRQFYNSKNLNFELRPRNLTYGFGCLNRRVAVHRILLGYYLNQKNLLDDMIFTQHALGDINANIYDTLPNFEDYKNLIPIFKQDQKCNVTDSAYAGVNLTPGKYVNLSDRYRAGKNMDFGHVMYSETYCNIVSESETEFVPYSLNRNIEIATEKTAKPFISKQVPLFLAGQGHLAYLKHLGFETMEDLMPPGYDQMRT
jgi:hypothetical protein